MRLKFLISLMLTFTLFACAKDQAAEGQNETLSQTQGDESSEQNSSNDAGSEKNNQASSNSGAETPAAPPGDVPSNSDVDNGAGGALDAPLEGTTASSGAEPESSDPSVPLDEALPPVSNTPPEGDAPKETASAPAPDPAPVATSSRSSTGRMVRYVMRDNTAILREPQAGAKEVGTLSKGDSVLIEEQGEYAKIGEGKFVAKEALSEEIVNRPLSNNPWK